MAPCPYEENQFGYIKDGNSALYSVPTLACIQAWEEFYAKGINKKYTNHSGIVPTGVRYTNYTPAGTHLVPDLAAVFLLRPAHTGRKIMFASVAVLLIIATVAFIIIHRRETASVLRALKAGVHPARIAQHKT